MAANTVTLLPDYPISIGNRRMAVATVTGPSSYTAVTPGSPPTGGQALSASQFGMKYLEAVHVGFGAGGTHTGYWSPASTTSNAVSSGILIWTVANGGAEASGDLSTAVLRVTAIGR